jgi:hypothetical protein
MKNLLIIFLLFTVYLFPQKLTTSAPTRLDLYHYYTDDLHLEITVLDDNGNGFDFTGYTGTFNLKRDESTSAALKSFSVSFSDSIIIIDIDTDSLTFLRAPKLVYYTLLLTHSGAPKTWLAGKFEYSVRPGDSQISSLTLAYSTTDLSLTIYGVSTFKDILSDSLNWVRDTTQAAFDSLEQRTIAHDTLKTDVTQNAADIAALEDTTDEHRNILDSLVNENYQYAMVHQQSYLPWNDAMWGIPGSGGDSTMENLRLAFSKTGRGDWIDVGVVFDPVWNLRDPSMIQIGDTFFVACTRNAFAGTGYGYFTILKSANLYDWTEVANISVAWAHPDGASGINAVWAPKWFYDETKDSTYIIVSINEAVSNSFQLYALKALNNNMNSFETGRRITITGKTSVIDGSVIIKDGTYYLFYKNEGCASHRCYERATASNLIGDYTTYAAGTPTTWGSDIEAFEIKKFGNVYRLYMDKYYYKNSFNDTNSVGISYAESYDLINWTKLYDMNVHASVGSVVKLSNTNLFSAKDKHGNPNYVEVGGDPYNYSLKMEGIREALKSIDSGVVYVNYPGVDDTTGLGAIPAKKYIRGWIAGKYTNGNAITSFGNDIYLTNGILRLKLDSLQTVYAPQWSGTSTGLNASTARTSLSLNNVENTALSTWAGSTNITTLGTITSGTWNAGAVTSSGNITAGSRFLAPNGTNSVPAYSFTNKTNSGWNMLSSGSLQYVSNGVPKITIDSAGSITSAGRSMRISTTGNIDAILTIADDYAEANVRRAILNFNDETTTVWSLYSDYNGGVRDFRIDNGGAGSTAALKIQRSTGNVFIGTTDDDGTPATGRVTIKASNNDGSSNIIVGRNSGEENKFRVSDRGTIYFDGGFYSKPVNQTNGYTPAVNDYIILLDETAGGGDVFMNAGIEGKHITIKKKDASANAVTLYPDGSETIDGAASYTLATQYKYVTMVFSSGHWWIIGNN